MVKRILIVILIVLSLSLLLSIESDATEGETNSEEADSNCKIEFAYDMDKIEVKVNGALLSSETKCITGTRSKLQQTIITATTTTTMIGYDVYREYHGMQPCSSGFVPQYSEINSTITFFIDVGTYKFTFDGGDEKECKFKETITTPNIVSTTDGYVINDWKYNDFTYPIGQELCVDESFLETNNIYKSQKLKFKSVLTPIDYKTAYDLNGGLATYANEEMVINLETPITMPDAPPIKDGFSFKCWKIGDVSLQCGDVYNLVYSTVDGNGIVIITAQWITTVTEDLAHCTLVTTNKCADYGEAWSGTLKPDSHYTMPSDISSDYVYTLNSDGTASIKINNVTAPISIVASAIPIEHTVILNPDGGNLDTGIITVNEVIEKELPTPTKEGCVFSGWYNDTTLITNTKNITSDCTLKASWRAITPSSSGDSPSSSEGSGSTSSGGNSSPSSSSSGSSTSSGSSGSSATPSGGGSSSTPSSGGSVTPTPVTDPETETEDTEITDETEGPTEEKEPETKVYEHRFYIDDTGRIWRIGDPSGISETPTRDGYTFGGWYILIDGERIPYTEGLNIDTNVYAIWNIVKTDGDGNPMIPAAAIASVLAVVLIVLVTGRKIN